MTIMKIIYAILGMICVGLGLLGIPLPGLPTTPFLLLALYFFAKSSDRLHTWFLQTTIYRKYLQKFHQTRTLSKSAKIRILAFSTSMIAVSIYFLPNIYGKAALGLLLLIQYSVFFFWVKTADTITKASENNIVK